MNLLPETATVYKGAHRRFFSKRAALKSFAWAMWKKKHPCECEGDVGFNCGRHGEYAEVRIERLVKKWEEKP